MRINNNMSAVVTNNQLLGTESSLADVMEKLSSGFNINHAGDNPSGIAISGKMQSQIDGLNQASRNGNDGISVLQTAEGALSEVTDMIQRMRELAVQAANGTNAQGERESIQLEIESLKSEIDRVSKSTQFNTLNLLDGSLDNRTYAAHCSRIQTSDSVISGPYKLEIKSASTQASLAATNSISTVTPPLGFVDAIDAAGGLSVGGTIDINGVSITLTESMSGEMVYQNLRQVAELGAAEVSDPSSTNLTISSKKYGADANLTINFSSVEFAAALGFTAADMESITITATDYGKDAANNDITSFESFIDNKRAGGDTTAGTITINGQEIAISATDRGSDIYEKIKEHARTQTADGISQNAGYDLISKLDEPLQIENVKTIESDPEALMTWLGMNTDTMGAAAVTKTGTNAVVDLHKGTADSQFGKQATYAVDGNKITITDTNGFNMSFLADEGYETTYTDDTKTTIKERGYINLDVTEIGSLTLQIGANEGQTMEVRIANTDTESLYIDELNVVIANGPEDAMTLLDDALNYITEVRAQLGAYENRLDHTTKSLDETSENMTSAISRIEDVDMATTMVEYTKLNVLEQAATSALAQANELPQLALQLLQ